MPKYLFYYLICFSAFAVSAFADESIRAAESSELTIVLQETAMPEMDDSRLGRILSRYYAEGLGGPENWEKIESIHILGTLTVESGEFELSAFQKKPDLVKMIVVGNQRELVLGFDGEIAWRRTTSSPNKEAVLMGPEEARRFIHNACFGNYLLYPYAEGKEVVYVDTVPVEGKICHQVRVLLDTGFQIDYFIDVRTYLEIMVNSVDLDTGLVSTVIYDGYTREYGMPIAKRVESREAGELVSELVLGEVKVNSGLMPWMFSKPKR